jgi:PhzF family phenazine biosynthesis protein
MRGCSPSRPRCVTRRPAFLLPEGDGWRLRWFTPALEVDLCGHATLASAHVLRELGRVRDGELVRFATRSGELRALVRDGLLEIDLPLEPALACDPPPEIAHALGGVTIVAYGANASRCVVEVGTADEVRAARPDFRALAALRPWGIALTARSDDPRHDFVSRFFAPAKGIDEDPVTGSSHCTLADWWGRALDRTELVAHQVSARGGVLRIRIGDGRVFLGGGAVTVLRGRLAG